MKICIFIPNSLPPGGHGYTVHNIAKSLVELGHDVVVLCRRKRNRREVSILNVFDYNYKVYKMYLPRSRGLFHKSISSFGLRRLYKHERLEVIHAITIWPAGFYAVSAFKDIDIPVIITSQGDDIQMEPEYNYGERLNPKIDRQVRYTLTQTPYLTAISKSMKEEMIRAGAPKDNVDVVYSGVNLTEYSNIRPYLHDKPYIFSLGRLVRKKGYDILLRAYNRFLESGDSDVDLLIGGEGPEKNSLIEYCRKENFSDDVHFVGFLNDTEKKKYLKGSLFFITPSRREPLGLVSIEAMACGKTVIGSNVDGIPDIITHQQDGLLFRPENEVDLAEKIHLLVNNVRLRNNLESNVHKKVRNFDWAVIARQYEKLYEKAVSISD